MEDDMEGEWRMIWRGSGGRYGTKSAVDVTPMYIISGSLCQENGTCQDKKRKMQ